MLLIGCFICCSILDSACCSICCAACCFTCCFICCPSCCFVCCPMLLHLFLHLRTLGVIPGYSRLFPAIPGYSRLAPAIPGYLLCGPLAVSFVAAFDASFVVPLGCYLLFHLFKSRPSCSRQFPQLVPARSLFRPCFVTAWSLFGFSFRFCLACLVIIRLLVLAWVLVVSSLVSV